MKNKISLTVITAVTLLAWGLAACASPATAEQSRIKVARGDIVQSASADGELSLLQQRKLTFGVDGKIEELKVEEGARVTRGQVLARLETATLERAVKTAELAVKSAEADRQQAEAGVQTARAALKKAEYGVKTAEADSRQAGFSVSAAAADVTQAEVGLKTAQTDLELANDGFRKIAYPYSYSTFAFDVPQALDSISSAERLTSEALKVLQTPGLSAEQYAAASRQLQQALDDLTKARQLLGRGQGTDVFVSELLPVKDYWTLRAAQLQMDKAKLGVETATGALSKAQLAVDSARNAFDKAQLNTGVARAVLDEAQAGVSNAEGVLSKAQLAVDKARHDLDTAKDILSKATITAPFDGVIARVNVKVGDVLTAADYTRTIMELIDPRRMEFTIKVDEMDIPGVETGQESTVRVDAFPGARVKGKVTFVSPLPKVEGGVVRYDVKIGFDVPEGLALKSGMSSTASILISQRQNVLLLPGQAITRNKSGQPVVRLVVNGQIEERVVETGISDGTSTEVRSGLNEGDAVLAAR